MEVKKGIRDMGIFNFLGENINEGVKEHKATPNSFLIDVRTKNEYRMGHVPGSINMPLETIDINKVPKGKLYLYCHSGGRSSEAARYLKANGFDAKNIGGIISYKGALERGEGTKVPEPKAENSKLKVLIIGGVAVGATAAARLRRLDKDAEIVVLERSGHVSYANCGLPYYIGGTIEEKKKLTLMTPEKFKEKSNIEARVGHEAISIDRENKEVTVKNLTTGEEYKEGYDKLVLAMGARPRWIEIEGLDKSKTFQLRNVEDTFAIKDYAVNNQCKTAAVLGGGFIAIEVAENLKDLGMEVSMVIRGKQIMPKMDPELAGRLQEHIEEKGVKILSEQTKEGFAEAVKAVDMVIMATGIVPDSHLAEEAGLEMGVGNGIVVDEHLRTSDPDIFAGGDAAQVRNFVSKELVLIPLAGPANKQGRVIADNIAGMNSTFNGSQGTSILKVFDMVAGSTGLNEEEAKKLGIDYLKLSIDSPSWAGYYPGGAPLYIIGLFDKATKKLIGGQVVGTVGVDKRLDVMATAIYGGMTAENLSEIDLAYAPPFSTARDAINVLGQLAEAKLTK